MTSIIFPDLILRISIGTVVILFRAKEWRLGLFRQDEHWPERMGSLFFNMVGFALFDRDDVGLLVGLLFQVVLQRDLLKMGRESVHIL